MHAIGALQAGLLFVLGVPHVRAAELRSVSFDELFAPARTRFDETVAEKIEREQALSVFKSVPLDEFVLSGFAASRKHEDFRMHLGFQYSHHLGDTVRLSSNTFYGAGTYNGDHSYISPELHRLPDAVRASGNLRGEWIGTDWQMSSRLFERHTLQASLEYRQLLGDSFLGQELITGQPNADRLVGLAARTEVFLSEALQLKAGLRYDGVSQSGTALDPRLELLYRPYERSTLRLLFNLAGQTRVAQERAWHPLLNLSADANRVQSYELAYDYSLDAHRRLHLSAYHYDIETLLAQPLDPAARLDAAGFELGMETRLPDGPGTRLSYAWQETNDLSEGVRSVGRHIAKLRMDMPLWANRLSTAFELQYHEVFSPWFETEERGFLVGNFTLASDELPGDTHLSIGMRNLFGTRYQPEGMRPLPALPQDGPSLRMDVSRKF